jgi:hypothetical protein
MGKCCSKALLDQLNSSLAGTIWRSRLRWRGSLFEEVSATPITNQCFSLRGQKRFIAERDDRGDNLSVRFYIQNSISLTIAALQRIFSA